MRFWVVAFIVVFVGVELFQWALKLGSWHPSGIALILGGVALATASNFSALSGSTAHSESIKESEAVDVEASETPQAIATPTAAEPPDEPDTISFKVRPLKR